MAAYHFLENDPGYLNSMKHEAPIDLANEPDVRCIWPPNLVVPLFGMGSKRVVRVRRRLVSPFMRVHISLQENY